MTPEIMPLLAYGAHEGPEDGACIMEYVSHLAGESWSDHPDCVHPVIATAARAANDVLGHSARQGLLDLIGRLTSTAEPFYGLPLRERYHINRELGIWAASRALAELAPTAADPDSTLTPEAYQACCFVFDLAAHRLRNLPGNPPEWESLPISVDVPADRCGHHSVRSLFALAESTDHPGSEGRVLRAMAYAATGARHPDRFLIDLLDRFDELLAEAGAPLVARRELTADEWADLVELTAAA